MGYIEDNVLTPEEEVKFTTRTSLWTILPKFIVILFILSALFGGYGLLINTTTLDVPYFWITMSIITILTILGFAIYHRSMEYVVTNSRVITKNGLLSIDYYEIAVENIESMDIDQSIMGRILNYGDLEINGTGNEDRRINNISTPIDFRKSVSS